MYLLSTGEIFRGDPEYFSQLFQEVVEDKQEILKRAPQLASNIAEDVSVMAAYLNRELQWRGPPSIEEAYLLDNAVL